MPYPVPAVEAVENLSRKFDGVTKEMLLEAAAYQYSSLDYHEATDTFLFAITYDRGTPLILNIEEDDDKVTLTSLSIAKSGRAVRRSYLTA